MKKLFLVITILISGFLSHSQTLTDISNALLGKKLYEINSTLDSLGVWYHVHMQTSPSEKYKILTVEDYTGTSFFAKLFIYQAPYNPANQYVKQITINLRHDNSAQIKSLNELEGYHSNNVGVRSTDVYYTIAKKGKIDIND